MKAMNLMRSDSLFYQLKNKDTVLAVFKWEDDDSASLVKNNGLPKFISNDFSAWLESRRPPKHREHMHRLLGQLGLTTLRSIIDYSHGLSLTDTLWVASDSFDARWEDVSLFRNEFDDTIARTAFDGGLYGLPISTTSPEFGTDGMLAKCWVRNNDGVIQLIKAGTSGACNAGNEPYSENLAHQVLDRLGYAHIPYHVKRFRGQLVSVCDLFTSETGMLLPIYRYYDFRSIQRLLELCTEDGIVEGLAQHLIFDYLSWNTDRHAGNLGVILDADTFELKRFAPIYDNGCSMLNYWNGEDDVKEYVKTCGPSLYNSFEQGLKMGCRVLKGKHNIEKLINFKFDRSQVPGYSIARVDVIEEWLQWRVQTALSMQ